MKELVGNLWTMAADIKVITTNGTVKPDGCAVMGRGCALEAKRLYPKLPRLLGYFIEQHGNHVYELKHPENKDDFSLLSFPTKDHVTDTNASLSLIIRSATELVALVEEIQQRRGRGLSVLMPRPGCGAGNREWLIEVRPLLQPLLNDQFTIITYDAHSKPPRVWRHA